MCPPEAQERQGEECCMECYQDEQEIETDGREYREQMIARKGDPKREKEKRKEAKGEEERYK